MALHQFHTAQSAHGSVGHATRAGSTQQQAEPWHYDFSKDGYGFPQPPKFDDKLEQRAFVKGRLAAAFRIFGQRGFDEGVAGHITARDPVEPHTMWVNPFGVAFQHMRRSDLIRIDYQGNVLEGGPVRLVNRAAVLIHAAVHQARPDVICAAHTHSCYGRAFSTLGIPLPITNQDGCAFYNDLALYGQFEGIVLEGGEGDHIAKAIGKKKAAILQNHGLITAADTIEACVFWYVSLEKLCQTYLLALAAVGGDAKKIKEVGEQEAKKYIDAQFPPSKSMLKSIQFISLSWTSNGRVVQRKTIVRLPCGRHKRIVLGIKFNKGGHGRQFILFQYPSAISKLRMSPPSNNMPLAHCSALETLGNNFLCGSGSTSEEDNGKAALNSM